MPAVDFGAAMKAAEKAGLVGGGGDTFKLKEGANRFRLVSECLPHNGDFKGTPTFKWLCLVIDRADGKVKAFFMPHTIYKQIAGLQQSEDYHFEGVPMPYDLTITASGAGTKEVKYTLMPAKKEVPLTADEKGLIFAHKTVQEVKTALDEKNARGGNSAPPSDDDFPPHTDDDN